MKIPGLVNTAVVLFSAAFTSVCHSADITANRSGNWSDTSVWSTGTVPGSTDTVDVPGGITVTLDTNATVAFVYDSGTLTMGTNTALVLLQDPMIAPSLNLIATARSNTVVYTGNPYNAKVCDYYNLMLANTNWTPPVSPYVNHFEDFNNFASASVSTATPMTIYGNMSVLGYIKVQEANVAGVPITIYGDLVLGQGCYWDCSSGNLTVMGNAYISGLLEDLDGAQGTNYINGSLTVQGPSQPGAYYTGGPYTNGWNLGDVITWGVGGSLTNNGAIYGKGFASMFLVGAGNIAGSNTLTIPTITIQGTYAVDTSIVLTTNNADLFGTLIFDLARTNQLDLIPFPGAPTTQITYYNGNLVVVNSGATPVPGKTYKLFDAANYAGGFSSETLPSLPAGLYWEDDLLTSGSLVVGGTAAGQPILDLSRNGNQLTLSWDSATFPGYRVQAQTNRNGLGNSWSPTANGTVSPFVIAINPTNPSVFFRLVNP